MSTIIYLNKHLKIKYVIKVPNYMQTMEDKTQEEYMLNDNWNMYYHLPDDKNWDFKSY